MSEFKSFQVGIYSHNNTTVACIHPLTTFGIEHCFGVDQSTSEVKVLEKDDLKLQSVITLMFESEYYVPNEKQVLSDLWAKLNAIGLELKRQERTRTRPRPLHTHKNIHEVGGNPPS